jgi:hypothetical protein
MKYNLRMTKQFVKYEVAVELKKLGFDEPCLGRWLVVTKWEKPTGEIILQLGTRAEDFDKNQFLAPTFSQAFRFFREKYNIQGYIYSSTVRGNAEKTKQFTGYIWNINGIDMPFLSTDARDELHDTYEEAELACLMKLIEIKNKAI